MTLQRRRAIMGGFGVAMLLIAGCEGLTGTVHDFPLDSSDGWQGRLSLHLQEAEGERAGNSWNAHFNLRGDVQRGTLLLTTLMGTAVAEVSWDPTGAWLRAQGAERRYADLARLTQELFGVAVPVDGVLAQLRGYAAGSNTSSR